MIAVIDIGSNSVRLMLWADGNALFKRINTTRLGEGIALGGLLSEEAIARTAAAVADFCREAKEQGADAVYAFATAAVRSAQNGAELCARVKRLCALTVDVVSGEEEAALGLKGALGDADGGMIDIGGASTEICFQKSGVQTYAKSLEVGAVRLYDLCGDDRRALSEEIGKRLAPLSVRPSGRVCAVGGTATTLAAVFLELKEYDPSKIQDCVLGADYLDALTDRLFSLSVDERRRIAGVSARRAEIIAGGALLLQSVMKKLSLREISVSDRDNLEGYLIVRGLV